MEGRMDQIASETPDVTWQRRLVELAVAGTALAVWRGAHDAFGMVKLSLLVFLVIGLVAVSVWRVLDGAVMVTPPARTLVPLGLVLALGLVAVATSDMHWQSLYGVYGRASGYVLYLASGLLLLFTVRTVTSASAWRVLRAIVVGGVLVAVYAILQKRGMDPIDWASVYGATATTSTLGNSNFVSGYVGITLPLAAWFAITDRTWMRWVGAGGSLALLGALIATRSAQGFVAAAAGLGLFGLVLVLERGGERRRQLLGAIAVIVVVGAAAVALGIAGKGPLGGYKDAGYSYRRYYWSAAVEMTADHPLSGVGFDRWGSHYREVRSPEAARSALTDVTDEPHSVPLSMFASGGVPLGLAYLAFVASVGWILVLGLRRTAGADRLILGAVGGGWLAYQVHSAVSIDVPAMPPVHFVLAGLIMVLSGAVVLRERTVSLLVRTSQVKSRRGNVNVSTYPRLPRSAAVGVAVVAGLVGLWQTSRPLRADVAVQRGGQQVATDPQGGLDSIKTGTHLSPWEPEYFSIVGHLFSRDETAQVAAAFFEGALKKDDRRFEDTVNAARSAAAAKDLTTATKRYLRALELEPNALEIKLEAQDVLVVGAPKAALAAMQQAVELSPSDSKVWALLARAQKANDQPDEATKSYERSFDLLPADDFHPWVDLIRTLRGRAEYDFARDLVERFDQQFGPEHHVDALYELALVAEAEGKNDEAITLYEQVMQLNPDAHPDAADRAEALRAKQ
jgi:O-antigen ligase/cytochrome c-type biogenesis protein CcmH/NrfG